MEVDYEIVEKVRLIEARELAGLNRAQLADKLGVHRAAVTRVEDGLRRPSLGLMMKWAAVLNCSLDLFSDDASRAA